MKWLQYLFLPKKQKCYIRKGKASFCLEILGKILLPNIKYECVGSIKELSFLGYFWPFSGHSLHVKVKTTFSDLHITITCLYKMPTCFHSESNFYFQFITKKYAAIRIPSLFQGYNSLKGQTTSPSALTSVQDINVI